MNTLSGIISLIALPLFMAVILLLAMIRKVDAYTCFTEGARGGIGLCIRTLSPALFRAAVRWEFWRAYFLPLGRIPLRHGRPAFIWAARKRFFTLFPCILAVCVSEKRATRSPLLWLLISQACFLRAYLLISFSEPV